LRTLGLAAGFAACATAHAGGVPSNALAVSDSAAPGGDGLQWSTAFNTIQAAVNAAIASGGTRTEIWVESGTYRPTQSFSTAPGNIPVYSLEIRGGVAVYGGFNGTETSRDQRDIVNNPCTIQPIAQVDGRSGVVVRVFGNAVLDGARILNVGNNQPVDRPFNGVAVFAGGVLRNVAVNGAVRGVGNALLAAADNAQLVNVEVSGDSTSGGHAGLRIAGNVRMIGGEIGNNTAGTGSTAGVVVVSGSPTFSAVEIQSNIGPTAAVRVTPGTTLINCRLRQNNNTAANPLGTAAIVGGTLINCVVNNNSSVGGLAVVRNARVINSTVFNNSRRGVIGGSIANSVIWGNGGPGENGVFAGQISDINPNQIAYSTIQGWTLGGTSDGNDPLLNGNGRLQTGSGAIDTGNNALVPRGVFRDADLRRRYAGTGTPGAGSGSAPRVDRGAFEASSSSSKGAFCYADFNDDGVLNASDQTAFTALFNINHPLADANGDGVFNAADQTRFTLLTAAGCP
jgi:hypothetical protein